VVKIGSYRQYFYLANINNQAIKLTSSWYVFKYCHTVYLCIEEFIDKWLLSSVNNLRIYDIYA